MRRLLTQAPQCVAVPRPPPGAQPLIVSGLREAVSCFHPRPKLRKTNRAGSRGREPPPRTGG